MNLYYKVEIIFFVSMHLTSGSKRKHEHTRLLRPRTWQSFPTLKTNIFKETHQAIPT